MHVLVLFCRIGCLKAGTMTTIAWGHTLPPRVFFLLFVQTLDDTCCTAVIRAVGRAAERKTTTRVWRATGHRCGSSAAVRGLLGAKTPQRQLSDIP